MRHDSSKLAWQVLLTAFSVFLVLLLAASYFAYWFVFQSRVPLSVDLSASRGTASINLPNTDNAIAVTNTRTNVENGVVIVTDSTSQALIEFYDSVGSTEPIGAITVFRDSEVTFHEMTRPRFNLNQSRHEIHAEIIRGQVEFQHFGGASRDTRLLVDTMYGSISAREPGIYLIDVNRTNTELMVTEGQARVWRPEARTFVRVRAQEMVSISDTNQIIEVVNAPSALLENSNILAGLEDDWLFYNDREPPGSAEATTFQGRDAILIDRSSEKYPQEVLDHGETGLVQNLNVSVEDYSYLGMRATFYVEEQSLSTCGSLASECPMMIRFTYLDEKDNEQVFIHGFYAEHDPSLGFPLACASCQSEHERINAETWYTYDSGNLITAWPEERLPKTITQVSFYASGHAYKVYISNLDLIALE